MTLVRVPWHWLLAIAVVAVGCPDFDESHYVFPCVDAGCASGGGTSNAVGGGTSNLGGGSGGSSAVGGGAGATGGGTSSTGGGGTSSTGGGGTSSTGGGGTSSTGGGGTSSTGGGGTSSTGGGSTSSGGGTDTSVTWRLSSPTDSPDDRYGTAMVWDDACTCVLLFGGQAQSEADLSDTEQWNGTNWTDRSPTVTTPGGRHAHGLAYDSLRQRVVLYGGTGDPGVGADTWEWDGTDWTHMMPAHNPGSLRDMGMTYDGAAQRVVLFGGENPDTHTYFSDVWEYDGTDWTLRATTSRPTVRSGAPLAYDSDRHVLVTFGGWDGSNYFADTHELNGATWTDVTPLNNSSEPEERSKTALVYDPVRHVVVMYGGYDDSNAIEGTWEWDGVDWTPPFPSNAPSPRAQAGAAWDAHNQQVVLFGGDVSVTSGSAEADHETWQYGLPP